jgi:hypothetical protein
MRGAAPGPRQNPARPSNVASVIVRVMFVAKDVMMFAELQPADKRPGQQENGGRKQNQNRKYVHDVA